MLRPAPASRVRFLLAFVAVLALAGCGGGSTEPSVTTPTSSPATTAPPSTRASKSESVEPTPTPSSSASSRTPSPSPSRSSATPSRSASPASTKNGTYANQLSLSEDGALSYVPLRWYTGADAKARCQERKVKAEGAWCTEYYYEKAGGRAAAGLTSETSVRLLNDDLKPVDASPGDLVQAIEDDVWPNFQVATAGGRVSRITQVYTP